MDPAVDLDAAAEHHDVVIRRRARPVRRVEALVTGAVVEVQLPAAFEDVLGGQDGLALLHPPAASCSAEVLVHTDTVQPGVACGKFGTVT